MERKVFSGNQTRGRSIAGFLSAAAGWSHGDRTPLSEFTEQLLRQGTGAICYQLRSQPSLSPFNAERLSGGTRAQKPARSVCLSPATRHSGKAARNASGLCQWHWERVPTPGSHQAVLAAQHPSLAGRCRWKKRWVSLSSPPARRGQPLESCRVHRREEAGTRLCPSHITACWLHHLLTRPSPAPSGSPFECSKFFFLIFQSFS